jgi:hypothetical protein
MASKKSLDQAKARAFQALGGACRDCGGVFDPICYDIHHLHEGGSLDRKTLGIRGRSVKFYRMVCENIDSYALLCSNCHRRIHAGKYLEMR